jgi:hypothetical protein
MSGSQNFDIKVYIARYSELVQCLTSDWQYYDLEFGDLLYKANGKIVHIPVDDLKHLGKDVHARSFEFDTPLGSGEKATLVANLIADICRNLIKDESLLPPVWSDNASLVIVKSKTWSALSALPNS